MKVKVFVLIPFLFAVLSLSAQENETKETITYSNITEFGFVTASPQGVGMEGTTVNGFAINKQHCIGIGIGIGGSFHNSYYSATAYTPLFFNYRLYFKPDKKFSPHINVSVGGLLAKDGEGIYSSITAGFRAGKFSFSSGISYMAIYRTESISYYEYVYDPYYYSYPYTSNVSEWYFPFGITIKCGFSF